MKKYFVRIALLLLFSPIAMAVTLESMSKDEATQAFSDVTFSTVGAVTLDNKIVDNKFTGYFSKDGKTTGQFDKKPDNGPQKDTGVWKVNDEGTMCFKWDHWDSNKEKCVNFYKLDNGILVVNVNNGFETMILSKDMKSGNSLK